MHTMHAGHIGLDSCSEVILDMSNLQKETKFLKRIWQNLPYKYDVGKILQHVITSNNNKK